MEVGGHYPFAAVGTELADGMKLRKAKIRGEFSNGMLCSEMELGLGRDEDGIMLLPQTVSAGQQLKEVLPSRDLILEVEVTPNRGDWLSHLGLARELSPTGLKNSMFPSLSGSNDAMVEIKTGMSEVQHGGLSILIESPDLCYRFLGVTVKGVSVKPSPEWLVKRLTSIGQQPINNIVDATNYVMFELGNPMHAFDLDKMRGNQVIVRNAKSGEKLVALDGMEYDLDAEILVVGDREAPQSIAGVIGGIDSSVTEGTVNILLECALFKPKVVRQSAKALSIVTDASYRFERGVDPEGHFRAIQRALEIILDIAGGEIEGPILEATPKPHQPKLLSLRLSRVATVLGVSFGQEEVQEILSSIGFVIEESEGDVLSVSVPSYRSYDITREIDLIEEIARVYGYDRFPDTLGGYLASTVMDDPLFQLEDDIRKTFTSVGINEAINPAFATSEEGDVQIQNPISSEESHLRNSLIPGLLRNLEYNLARSIKDIRLFEIGTVFAEIKNANTEQAIENTNVAAVMIGRRTPSHWMKGKDDPVDFWTVKGIVVDALDVAGWDSISFESSVEKSDRWNDGRTVALTCDGKRVGVFGQVSPEYYEAPKWAGEVWALEFRLPLKVKEKEEIYFQPLPQYPSIDRDLACLMGVEITSDEVITTINSVGGDLLQQISIFDVYQGQEVSENMCSLGIRMKFQSFDRTLTDTEVDRSVDKIVRRLAKDLDVQQRL
ncbi:MAG: phenylalanine--tRNA ligase subunit beta [Gemmatimonadetes bacterium]|nr:phenylalanine--tRNA ligase subunit beta [Gemmatimonadota bacterium]